MPGGTKNSAHLTTKQQKIHLPLPALLQLQPLAFSLEEAGKRRQWLPQKPQKRPLSNRPFQPGRNASLYSEGGNTPSGWLSKNFHCAEDRSVLTTAEVALLTISPDSQGGSHRRRSLLFLTLSDHLEAEPGQ